MPALLSNPSNSSNLTTTMAPFPPRPMTTLSEEQKYSAYISMISQILNFQVYGSLSGAGVLFSLVNVVIFSLPTFKGSLYKYLLIQSALDLLGSIIACLSLLVYDQDIGFTFAFQVYMLYFARYLNDVLNTTSFFLSIFVSFDRYVLVSQKFKSVCEKLRPVVVLAALFLLSGVVHMFFVIARTVGCVFNCDLSIPGLPAIISYAPNSFIFSIGYKIWSMTGMSIRCVVTPVLFIVVNVLLVAATKKHLEKKRRLMKAGASSSSNKKGTKRTDPSAPRPDADEEATRPDNQSTTVTQVAVPSKQPKSTHASKVASSDNLELKVVLMVIVSSLIVAVLQAIEFMTFIIQYVLAVNSSLTQITNAVGIISNPFRVCTDIFIYYFFNNHFKRALHDLLTLRLFMKKSSRR